MKIKDFVVVKIESRNGKIRKKGRFYNQINR